MFELEQAIQTWKRQLQSNPAFEDGDVVELESHLRDEIERLVAKGLSEKEAFQHASKEIGELESIGVELYKTRTSKVDATPPWKQKSWIPTLLPNYLKVALRTFKRHPGYTSINIFGLAVGLAACLLIFLFVQLGISYDRFHSKNDRIYRVATDVTQGGHTRELAWSSPPLAQALKEQFPEVEQAVRIHRPGGTMRRNGESEVVEVSFVDSTFFDVFDFKLSRGDAETALSRPGNIVLSQEQVSRFFDNEDPMHKTLTFADTLHLEVTGILAEIPENSHFQPQFLANFQTLPQQRFRQWQGMNLWTYIVLNENTNGAELESKLPGFIESTLGEVWAQIMTLHLQPLTSIYFESDRLPEIGPTGDSSYTYIFSGIGLFLLLIASINFMNLATAQSLRRAKEVGVRKVLGVTRWPLVRQFLGESILLTFLAMVVGLFLAQLALPLFSEVSGYDLSGIMLFEPKLLAVLTGATTLLGVLSGSYPAFVLTLFKPSAVLSGNVSVGNSNLKLHSSNNWFRRGLVTLQFVITVVLLIGTGVISSQLTFIQNKNLGFNDEQVVVVRLSDELRDSYDPFKQNLLRHSNILNVGASSQVPGIPVAPRGYRPEGMTEGELLTNTIFVDEDYLETMQINLAAGRDFSPERPTDLSRGFILNKAAVRHFGWSTAEEALGKTVQTLGENGIEGRVTGITENFNYESLHNEVNPLVIRYREPQYLLSIRIAGNGIADTMDDIEEEWNSAAANEPFVSWFLDERLQDLYESEKQMSDLFRYFSAIAIVIACLGLFGLASFSIQRRTKEIGIRKVLGASLSRVMLLLTKEYVWLLVIANLVAWPVAYISMNRWLNDFAYHTDLSVWIFLAAGGAVLLIALATVSYHSIRAGTVNPVQSLRSE